MATHSSILVWRISWTEEPGRLQSMGLQSPTRLSGFHFHFFSGRFYPRGHLEMSRDIVTPVNGGCVATGSSEQKPGMLLDILQYTTAPPLPACMHTNTATHANTPNISCICLNQFIFPFRASMSSFID